MPSASDYFIGAGQAFDAGRERQIAREDKLRERDDKERDLNRPLPDFVAQYMQEAAERLKAGEDPRAVAADIKVREHNAKGKTAQPASAPEPRRSFSDAEAGGPVPAVGLAPPAEGPNMAAPQVAPQANFGAAQAPITAQGMGPQTPQKPLTFRDLPAIQAVSPLLRAAIDRKGQGLEAERLKLNQDELAFRKQQHGDMMGYRGSKMDMDAQTLSARIARNLALGDEAAARIDIANLNTLLRERGLDEQGFKSNKGPDLLKQVHALNGMLGGIEHYSRKYGGYDRVPGLGQIEGALRQYGENSPAFTAIINAASGSEGADLYAQMVQMEAELSQYGASFTGSEQNLLKQATGRGVPIATKVQILKRLRDSIMSRLGQINRYYPKSAPATGGQPVRAPTGPAQSAPGMDTSAPVLEPDGQVAPGAQGPSSGAVHGTYRGQPGMMDPDGTFWPD